MNTLDKNKLKLLKGPIRIIGIRREKKLVPLLEGIDNNPEQDTNEQERIDNNLEQETNEQERDVTILCLMIDGKKYEMTLGGSAEEVEILDGIKEVNDFNRIDEAFKETETQCYCVVFQKNEPPYHFGSGEVPISLNYENETAGYDIVTFSGKESWTWNYDARGEVTNEDDGSRVVVSQGAEGFTIADDMFTKSFDQEHIDKLEEEKMVPGRLYELMDDQRRGKEKELEQARREEGEYDEDPQEKYTKNGKPNLSKISNYYRKGKSRKNEDEYEI